MALLKYGKYIEKLKLTAQAVHMQIMMELLYLLDQTTLSISRRSRIIATPPDVLNVIVTALEY